MKLWRNADEPQPLISVLAAENLMMRQGFTVGLKFLR